EVLGSEEGDVERLTGRVLLGQHVVEDAGPASDHEILTAEQAIREAEPGGEVIDVAEEAGARFGSSGVVRVDQTNESGSDLRRDALVVAVRPEVRDPAAELPGGELYS